MEDLKTFWTEEFAPRKLDDMVLSDELRSHFSSLLKSGSRFNLLLAGSPGIGKTTLAKIMAGELNACTLFIPCAVEGTVATAQGKLRTFCESLEMEGRPKLVILDELDSASGTQDNSFQKVLRNVIGESTDTMFIGTCNYPEKVIDPIKSRLGVFSLKFTKRDLLLRMMSILNAKKVKYCRESVVKFVETSFAAHYPDVRRIVADLQASCSSGELVVVSGSSRSDSGFVDELMSRVKAETDVLKLREFCIQSKPKVDDWKALAGAVFDRAISEGMVTSAASVLRMSDIIYQMNVVIDPEIQFFALVAFVNSENGRKNAKN